MSHLPILFGLMSAFWLGAVIPKPCTFLHPVAAKQAQTITRLLDSGFEASLLKFSDGRRALRLKWRRFVLLCWDATFRTSAASSASFSSEDTWRSLGLPRLTRSVFSVRPATVLNERRLFCTWPQNADGEREPQARLCSLYASCSFPGHQETTNTT